MVSKGSGSADFGKDNTTTEVLEQASNSAVEKITTAKFCFLQRIIYICVKFRRRENNGGEKINIVV